VNTEQGRPSFVPTKYQKVSLANTAADRPGSPSADEGCATGLNDWLPSYFNTRKDVYGTGAAVPSTWERHAHGL